MSQRVLLQSAVNASNTLIRDGAFLNRSNFMDLISYTHCARDGRQAPLTFLLYLCMLRASKLASTLQ